MKTVGEKLIGLKSKTIKERKPGLTICSNHRMDDPGRSRMLWNSTADGTAYRVGPGRYSSERPEPTTIKTPKLRATAKERRTFRNYRKLQAKREKIRARQKVSK